MSSQWLHAFHAGEETVFKEAVAEHSSRLKAYCQAFVKDDSVAEDLVQETWLRAYRNRRSFEGRGSFLAWLLAISRTTALSHLRTQRHRRALSQSQQGLAGSDPRHASEQANVLDQVAHRDEVRTALLALAPRQRDTVVLRVLEDRSVRDTARIMGCTEGTVKAALSKAMNNLRTILEGAFANTNEREVALHHNNSHGQHGDEE